MMIQLSECYEIVTEDSAEYGEAEEQGYIREGAIVRVREAIEALRECSHVSSWPIAPSNMTGHEWATTEAEQDYRTGAYESRSIHITREDGRPLSPHQLYRLFRAAGLTR